MRSSFNDLYFGVYGINSGGNLRKFHCGYSLFEDNYFSLTLNNFINPEILDNNFVIPRWPYAIGAWLNASEGYAIENNSFSFQSGIGFPTSQALLIQDSGEDDNEVYRNHFSDLESAIVTQGVNGDLNLNDPGLRFFCNVFDEDIRVSDIFVNSGTVSDEQGMCTLGGNPAGNFFSHSHEQFAGHMDFRLNVSQVLPNLQIAYRHHILPPARLAPEEFTNNSLAMVLPTLCTLDNWDPERYCPVKLSGAPVPAIFPQQELGEKSGDIDEADQAETIWSYEQLLAIAQAYEDSIALLGGFSQTQTSSSADSDIEETEALTWMKYKRGIFWRQAVNQYQNDTVGIVTPVQMLALLNEYQPKNTARFASSLSVLLGGSAALWAEEAIVVASEAPAIVAVASGEGLPTALPELYEQSFFAHHEPMLALNENYIANETYYLPHYIDYGTSDEVKALSKAQYNDTSNAQDDLIEVYPNPFNDQVIMDFGRLPDDAGSVSIRLYDLSGRLLHSRTFAETRNHTIVQLNGFSEGLYLYTIHVEGEEMQRGKLIKVN